MRFTCFLMCLFVLGLLLFPSRGGRVLNVSFESKIGQADFTDWMSFLPSNPMEEIALIQNPLTQIPKTFYQYKII